MKKVILFIDNLGSGGAQRQVANVAVLLKKAGFDVSVLVYQDYPFYKTLLDSNDVPLVLVESSSSVGRILSIRKYLNSSDADAVIVFLETPCFVAGVAKMLGGKWSYITTERSAKMSTFTTRRNRFFNFFERFACAKVGNSRNAIRMWQKFYPRYNDKYSVIYNYILVPDEFVSSQHEYLADGRVHIAVAASYQELKNPLKVVEALGMLTKEQREKIKIDWYGQKEITTGNTETYEKVVRMVDELQISDCITINGETNEIYKIMSESDVVGLFSTVDGLPNTICEAMTIGKPVVMSTVSDYDVLVTDNGYLCDPNSVESIRDALLKLIETPKEEFERMGKASREKAQMLFSAEAITKQWTDIIENHTKRK